MQVPLALIHNLLIDANQKTKLDGSQQHRMSDSECVEFEIQIAELLATCWVTYSNSQIMAPVSIFTWPGGSGLHMCVDYGGLNAITPGDQYPLPYMGEFINQVHASSVFTNLEVANGYHQIHIHPENRQITPFVNTDGLFIRKLEICLDTTHLPPRHSGWSHQFL